MIDREKPFALAYDQVLDLVECWHAFDALESAAATGKLDRHDLRWLIVALGCQQAEAFAIFNDFIAALEEEEKP